MWRPRPELAGHPDRLRWNARYGGDYAPAFRPHPLAARALRLVPAAGPVLELAAGPSGGALLAAANGHPVTVVDVSDTGLGLLAAEAARRGVADRLAVVHADLAAWAAGPDRYALVLCTNFWERAVFHAALGARGDPADVDRDKRARAVDLPDHRAALHRIDPDEAPVDGRHGGLQARENDAGLLVERLGFLQDGRAMEFTQSFYRGDIYDFVAELSVSS